MVLDLPKKGVSNIPNVLKGNVIYQPGGYGSSPESSQQENYIYNLHGNNTAFEEIYTVPAGKTLYISSIILTTNDGDRAYRIATGAAASETDFLVLSTLNGTNVQINLNIPMKFTSGIRISWKPGVSTSADHHITLIGWEE